MRNLSLSVHAVFLCSVSSITVFFSTFTQPVAHSMLETTYSFVTAGPKDWRMYIAEQAQLALGRLSI